MPTKAGYDYKAAAKKSKADRAKQDAAATEADYESQTKRPLSPDNIYTEQIGLRVSRPMKKFLKQTALDHDTTVNDLLRTLLQRAMNGDIDLAES